MSRVTELAFAILFASAGVLMLAGAYKLTTHGSVDTQCWTNTFPNKTHTWHPIRCPEGVGK